jgi:hypothetical protein
MLTTISSFLRDAGSSGKLSLPLLSQSPTHSDEQQEP